MLALTSSHSSSSPGVESNQNNVTCFDLIRSHQTRLLVRQQEVTLKSNDCSHWMDSRVTSTQPTVRLISEANEKIYNWGYVEVIVQQFKGYLLLFVFLSHHFYLVSISSLWHYDLRIILLLHFVYISSIWAYRRSEIPYKIYQGVQKLIIF